MNKQCRTISKELFDQSLHRLSGNLDLLDALPHYITYLFLFFIQLLFSCKVSYFYRIFTVY